MYKVSKELNDAISSIFSNPEEGLLALGAIDADVGLQQEQPLSEGLNPLERVAVFRRKLEDWVELYGLEIQEFDSEYDSLRISSEAKALLLALREIQRCFPEVETTKKK
jgi:hypothetical protein